MLYDVLKEKNMYGKKVIGIERSTFVIDEKGKIIKIFRKVNVDGHEAEVLDVL
jgi:peroxiredoxin Q/BCP